MSDSSQSATVVHGSVSAVDAYWREADQMIVSDVTVLVHEALSGNSPQILKLSVLGGELPERNLRATTSAAPLFLANEEVVLWLQRNPQDNRLELAPGLNAKQIVHNDVEGTKWIGNARFSDVANFLRNQS